MPTFTPPAELTLPSINPPDKDPLDPRDPTAYALFRHFGPRGFSGITVIKNEDGTYTETTYPTHDELQAAKQQVWPDGEKRPVYYLGGHIYSVTAAEAADLGAAGYGAYLT